jgi:hypothetical protein
VWLLFGKVTGKQNFSHERIIINKKGSSRSQLCLNTNLSTLPVARGGWRGIKAFTVTKPKSAAVLAVTKVSLTEISPPIENLVHALELFLNHEPLTFRPGRVPEPAPSRCG